jgi:hypothetical protein
MRRAEGVRRDVEPAVDAPEGSGALVDQARPFPERAASLAGWSGAIATRVGTTHWKSPRELLTVDAIRHAVHGPGNNETVPEGTATARARSSG